MPTREDQGMHYVGNMYCHSTSLQIQYISSKCTSPPSMHNECNHACSKQPVYPSYIPPYPSLPSSFHPFYLFPSTLSPYFLPYSFSYSHHILPTPPCPPKQLYCLIYHFIIRWLIKHINFHISLYNIIMCLKLINQNWNVLIHIRDVILV